MKVLLLAVAGFLVPLHAMSLDVVHLKSGQFLTCEISAVTDNILSYSISNPSVRSAKPTLRTIQMDQVDYIDFGFSEGEEGFYKMLEKASTVALKNAWNAQYGNLHRPRSRTARYGIAYAHALLKEDRDYPKKEALEILDRILERAWSDKDKSMARQGRLLALIGLGELDRAFKDAAIYARETKDPAILIEVKFLQAKVEFEQLKKLIEENPKWEEDDEIRPRRNELYHSSVDQFLWPYLFHGTFENSAVRGLRAAAGVYHAAGETKLEEACLKDIARLYPNHTIKTQKEE